MISYDCFHNWLINYLHSRQHHPNSGRTGEIWFSEINKDQAKECVWFSGFSVLFNCFMTCVSCSPDPTWYISHFCGTLWRVCAQTAVKHQSTTWHCYWEQIFYKWGLKLFSIISVESLLLSFTNDFCEYCKTRALQLHIFCPFQHGDFNVL